MNRLRTGYTLVELLVVVAIIALLATLLFPVIGIIQAMMDRARTLDLIQGLQMTLTLEKVGNQGYSMPDNDPVEMAGSAEERIGFFMYDRNEVKPYLINRFVEGYGYAFDASTMLNDDDVIIDSWGEPLRYVLGDSKNRDDSPAYDPTLPQDLNKPKDGDKPAAESDWNSEDGNRFPYIYSTGPEQLQESWIYYVD